MAVFWSAVSLKYAKKYRTFGRPSGESVNQDLHILWWFHWIVTASSLSWKYTWTQHLMHWLWMGSEVSNFPSSIKSLEYDIQLPRKVLFRYDHHASVLWFSINFPKIKLPSIFHRRRETKCWTPTITRSIHLECSVKKGVLRNFTKLTGKHLCQVLFCAGQLLLYNWILNTSISTSTTRNLIDFFYCGQVMMWHYSRIFIWIQYFHPYNFSTISIDAAMDIKTIKL